MILECVVVMEIANEIDLEHNNIGKFLVLSYINQKWIDESHDLVGHEKKRDTHLMN
jgi:hypothetical protein